MQCQSTGANTLVSCTMYNVRCTLRYIRDFKSRASQQPIREVTNTFGTSLSKRLLVGFISNILPTFSRFPFESNRGKESVTLNVKEGADKETLDSILAQADVFVQNLGKSKCTWVRLAE